MPGLPLGTPDVDDPIERAQPLDRAHEKEYLEQSQGRAVAESEQERQGGSCESEPKSAFAQQVRSERERTQNGRDEQEVPHGGDWIRRTRAAL